MWEKYYTNKMYLLLLFVREIIKYADSERVVSYVYISHIGIFYSNRAISSWREIVTEVALPLYL